jgi:hypothetical protein
MNAFIVIGFLMNPSTLGEYGVAPSTSSGLISKALISTTMMDGLRASPLGRA